MNLHRVSELQWLTCPRQWGSGCLLHLVSEGGLSGLGELPRGAPDALAEALDGVASCVLGRSALDRQAIWQAVCQALLEEGEEAWEPFLAAVAAGVDAAVWDLAASALGTGVGTLMGGTVRRRLDLCADCGPADDPGAVQAAQELLSRGLRLFSFDVPPDASHASEVMKRVRRVLGVGPLLVLRVAAPPGDVAAATALGVVLDRFEPYWIEGLLPDGQWAELARVRGGIASPTGAGGATPGLQRLQRALESGCADVIAGDLGQCLGPTGALRLADMTDTRGLRLSLTAGGTLASALAAAHVCFARGNVTPLRLPLSALAALLSGPAGLVQDGFLAPPQAVGLGLSEGDVQGVEVLGRIAANGGCRAAG